MAVVVAAAAFIGGGRLGLHCMCVCVCVCVRLPGCCAEPRLAHRRGGLRVSSGHPLPSAPPSPPTPATYHACGCPRAERAQRVLRAAAERHQAPERRRCDGSQLPPEQQGPLRAPLGALGREGRPGVLQVSRCVARVWLVCVCVCVCVCGVVTHAARLCCLPASQPAWRRAAGCPHHTSRPLTRRRGTPWCNVHPLNGTRFVEGGNCSREHLPLLTLRHPDLLNATINSDHHRAQGVYGPPATHYEHAWYK